MLQKVKGFHKPKGIECELETLTSTYGKFIAEPLERGFGQTLGNSLRRILLSSIEGAAVTTVRIASVHHEFSTIPGVKEDVTDLVLNVKGLRVKMAVEGPRTLHLKATGPGEVRASQIVSDAEVEIVNPNFYIATLDKDGKLQMEIEVGRGRGYASAERNKRENQPVDVIAVDSVFSPIVRVNYQVEDTRVGHATDYNKLTLESSAPLMREMRSRSGWRMRRKSASLNIWPEAWMSWNSLSARPTVSRIPIFNISGSWFKRARPRCSRPRTSGGNP